MGGPKPKWDKEITELFNQGLGAQKIAEKLDIKHLATVSKRLIKLGLRRPVGSNQSAINGGQLSISFAATGDPPKAAQKYLEFICVNAGYPIANPEPDAPFDLLVDFGTGFRKIQIKSSRSLLPSGNYTFQLQRVRHNSTAGKRLLPPYNKEDVDFFFFYDIAGNTWLVPFSEVKTKTRVVAAHAFPGYIIDTKEIWRTETTNKTWEKR